MLNGANTFTAVAEDAYGRKGTNTASVWLPSSATCAYDVRGNLTNDGRRVFYYDDENQLTTVLISNAWRSDFVYDGMMRRRVRKEYTWSAGAWLQTNEVRYIYDGRVVLQERWFVPTAGTLIPQNAVTYTRGNDLSGTLQGAGGIGGLLARTDSALPAPGSGPHAYYHCDGNGNITALIATNQTTVASYHYDPYGNLLGMAGPLAVVNLYRFSSKELHPNSGLVYYLYRCYEPTMQRWLNRDPIQEWGGWHLYRYAVNAPLHWSDPLGLDPGDVYVYCGNNAAQSIIGALTPGGGAGHVGIEVPGGQILTARPGQGVTLDPKASIKDQNVKIYRPTRAVDQKKLTEFTKEAISKNTSGYDYSALSGWQRSQGKDEYTCASLVAAALRQSGVPFKRDWVTTPNNIANEPNLKPIPPITKPPPVLHPPVTNPPPTKKP